jgi:UPF0755 protein
MMKPSKGLIFFLVFSILLISFAFYTYQICYSPNILVGKQDRVFVIPKGSDFKYVQKQFHENNVTQDLMSFSFLSRLMGYRDHVKPGRYLLRAGMTNIEAIRLLRAGIQEPVKITFNNVRLIRDLSEKITRNLNMKPEEFEAALISFTMTNKFGFNKDNILTMFIPNTYEVYYHTSAEELVARMQKEYELFWSDEKISKAKAIGLTPVEASILASIVQAESVKPDEAPVIASLYINRLKKGIPLQADPTLVFAVGDFSLKRVLNEHKEVDSPYNTYKYAGLPPGPINMPEINSILAVLDHKKTDYLYMCAREDFSGYHNFTSDYQQHMNNAIRYQRALTNEMRKAAAQRKK